MGDFINGIEKNSKMNSLFLRKFKMHMLKEDASIKSINEHIRNTDFYINDFLSYYSIIPAEEGCSHLDCFFSDWFIRKAMWCSPQSVKENIKSLTMFYKFMYKNKDIPKREYDEMVALIEKESTRWIENA